jgi:predicted DsbA family dithiol-disulfide isomerase
MSRTTADDAVVMYSDYVCPFCYLGKASLQQYRAEREESIDVEWHPFDLRGHKRDATGEIDESVEDGKDEAYFEQAKENVQRLQEEYDVEMDLDIATEIDSWNAQQASLYVRREHPEAFDAFHDAVYDALWTGEPTFAYDGYAARGAVPPAQLQRLVEGPEN